MGWQKLDVANDQNAANTSTNQNQSERFGNGRPAFEWNDQNAKQNEQLNFSADRPRMQNTLQEEIKQIV